MALSPADFVAYSRATGAPYPEDPEERAQMAPEVAEFRRNQLRAPQQESALPGILGAAAVGLGALTGGMALARALGGKRGQTAASTAYNIPRKAEQDIRTVATPVRQRVAEDVVRQARTERPTGTVLTDLPYPKTDLPISRTPGTFREFSRDVSGASAADRLAQDPELLSLVQQQAKEELSEARSKQSIAQAEYRNLLSSIADDIIAQERAAVRGPVANQTIGALESGEDQMTGRTMRAVQRNEDLDVSQVNQAARQTGSANVAASMTPDGVPVDQTYLTYLVTEKQFLLPGQRLQERAQTVAKYQTPTPVSLIGKYPASPEDPQNIGRFPGTLGTSTEDVVTYSPAYGGVSNIVRRNGLEITPVEGRIAGLPARYTALPRGSLTEGFRFSPASVTVSLTPEEAVAKLTEFQTSKESQIAGAMARGLSEARARRNVQISPSQKEAIEVLLPTYSPEDVMSQPGLKAYGDIAEAERFTEEMSSKSGRLESLEQGGFLEKQVDPGELRGEPQQVRKGVMISPASKTSYRGVIGRPGYGIYGEQAGGRAGTPVFGAGAVEAAKEIKTEGETRGITTPRKFTPGLDDPRSETPEGFVYTEEAMVKPTRASGGYKKYGTQPPTPKAAATESLNVSSELLRLQREQGPEAAQNFLDKMMQERQISALGSSQPLRQRVNRQGRFVS